MGARAQIVSMAKRAWHDIAGRRTAIPGYHLSGARAASTRAWRGTGTGLCAGDSIGPRRSAGGLADRGGKAAHITATSHCRVAHISLVEREHTLYFILYTLYHSRGA